MAAHVTILGLGPAGGDLLTRRAWQTLLSAPVVFLRTARHPAVADLPPEVQPESFDEIYDSAADFAEVYEQIASRVIERAQQNGHVVYAVPGDPHTGEATVARIREAAGPAGVTVSIIPGVSFMEPVLSALGVDALNGLQLFDAIDVAALLYPPLDPDTPALLGQVYSRLLAGELKLTLMAAYPPAHQVALVHAAGSDQEVVEWLPLHEMDHSTQIDHLTTLYVPPRPVPAGLPAFAEAIAYLRSPQGCPWDQEQTPQSMRSGFLEEVAEVLDAIDADDPAAIQEELGDVLLHIVMQAQMASEEDAFALADVVAGIYAKIKRRHPHVWGDWEAAGSAEVEANWEALKAQEKRTADADESLLDNLPQSLPALARSQKIQGRVRKVGFDWPDISGVLDKVREELAEVESAGDPAGQQAEIGDLLFTVVNLARWLDVDAEVALREANQRFSRRFRRVEQLAAGQGLELAALDMDALDRLWQEAKQAEA